ncbi:MAG: gliding motility-associated C-terminal domain-containing protein [Bacteroidales bacterium]|nr:gliding motility-associated C-terminal domain-containing protein [Bacteroidales bacterium]
MSSLKEKFDQMEIAPDERVWEKINATMGRKARRRRLTTVGAGAAVALGLAAALLLTLRETPTDKDAVVTAQANTEMVQQTAATQPLTAAATTEAESTTPDLLTTAVTATEKETATTATERTSTTATVTAATSEAPTTPAQETRPAEKKATATAEQPTGTERVATTTPTRTTTTENATKATNNTSNTTDKKAPEQKQKAAKSGGNDSLAIWIPNAFSPDDPTNDKVRCFKVFANNPTTILSYEIYIYSRTGRQVYHSRDINECWDGTAKGYAQPMGTYVYVIEVKDAVKGLQHKRGTITLLR